MLYAIGRPGQRIDCLLDEPPWSDVSLQLQPGQMAVLIDAPVRGSISDDGAAVIPEQGE